MAVYHGGYKISIRTCYRVGNSIALAIHSFDPIRSLDHSLCNRLISVDRSFNLTLNDVQSLVDYSNLVTVLSIVFIH